MSTVGSLKALCVLCLVSVRLLVGSILVCVSMAGCNSSQHQANREKEITIRIVHSPEIQSFLNTVVEGFHLSKPVLSDKTEVKIELRQELAHVAADRIAKGHLKTHGWFTSSLSYTNFANGHLRNLGPQQIECEQLFATPVVVAVPQKQLQFFQTENNEFSWNDFVATHVDVTEGGVTNAKGWVIHHPNPLTSATGYGALIQLAYLAIGKEGALGVSDLREPQYLESIRQFESFVGSYGYSEAVTLTNTANAGSDRIHVAITTEQQVALFNSRMQGESSLGLVALYPKEGSFWMDYGVCVSQADWVTAAHRAALSMFVRALSSEVAQRAAEKRGFRPSKLSLPPMPPLTSEFGVNTNLHTKAFLPIPGESFAFLQERWPDIVRPKALLLVLDTSGSMEGAPLRVGKKHFRNILAASSWKDQKALISFATTPVVVDDFTTDRDQIIPKLDTLTAVGGSAVYDSIKHAIDLILSRDLGAYRKTIVVFTDGDDKNSETTFGALKSYIQEKVLNNNIDLVLVGVSRDIDFSDLRALAEAGNGVFRQGGLDDMEAIFEQLAANIA
jgi:Ca-activated chloride channel family protein